MRPRTSRTRPNPARAERLDVSRAAMLLALLLVAILRPVLGPAVVQHDHHDLGAHTHLPAVVAIDDHHTHGHDHHQPPGRASDAGVPTDAPGPCGPVISLFDEHSLPGGSTTLSARSPATKVTAVPEKLRPAAPCLRDDPGAPGGRAPRGPHHLAALAPTGRLIATSRALLI